MTAVTIRLRLDERRAAARARAIDDPHRGRVDRVGVVPVDDDRLQAVRGRAIGGRMLHRRHLADRRVLHVEVVLADEDHGQLPHDGQVERLVERADVRGAVAEEADDDLSRLTLLRRPRGAGRDRHVRAHDRVRAHRAVLDAREVHRPALAAADPGRASQQLRHQRAHRRAAEQRVHVPAIRAEDEVVGAERGGEARGDGFLSEREVRRALDQPFEEQVLRAAFEQPRLLHHPVHVEADRFVRQRDRLAHHGSPSVLVRDHELFAREERDDPRPVGGHDDLLLDPRGRATVGGRAVRLEGEQHALLQLDRLLERVEPADDRPLVQPDARRRGRTAARTRPSRRRSRTPPPWATPRPGRPSTRPASPDRSRRPSIRATA